MSHVSFIKVFLPLKSDGEKNIQHNKMWDGALSFSKRLLSVIMVVWLFHCSSIIYLFIYFKEIMFILFQPMCLRYRWALLDTRVNVKCHLRPILLPLSGIFTSERGNSGRINNLELPKWVNNKRLWWHQKELEQAWIKKKKTFFKDSFGLIYTDESLTIKPGSCKVSMKRKYCQNSVFFCIPSESNYQKRKNNKK